MATFLYNALTRDGDLVRGELTAADACAAIARLHDQALLPIDATEATAARPRLRFAWRKTRPLPGPMMPQPPAGDTLKHATV